ncbi:hypothetical protein N9C96_01505 [bacterium]|nr:hypothetical protein [bacterium]
MALNISLPSGALTYANPAEAVSDQMFGARYISYRNIDRFLDQIEDANIGLIVWPGGTLAETRADRYGFDFDGLQNPANNKPALDEMMEIAITKGASLSVILPTARYTDDLASLQSDLSNFLANLLAGDYGPLPDDLIFEVGSEYYANFSGDALSQAAQYGAVAEVMITEIAAALADPSINLIGADINIAAQAGKTMAEDVAIRDALSEFATDNVDSLIHHRFAFQPQGIDPRIAELQGILDAWETETGEEPNLFVSAWNTVTLTRNGVLNDYIEYQAAQGSVIDASDVDLNGRTTTEFETFWQDELDEVAYGQEHAAYILESFASYAEAGADAASLYGVDLIHPGRVSWRENGSDYDFVGAKMLEMIYESVGGTHVLTSDDDYDTNALATSYGFENEDKLVLFVAAGHSAPGQVCLTLDGFGEIYNQVWVERLTGETPSDWKTIFGIPDNPDVDETAEGDTYAVGIREVVTPDTSAGALTFSLSSPHEVIRLAFAKTAAGAHEIAGWAEGQATDLAPLGEDGPPSVLPDCLSPKGCDSQEQDADETDSDMSMVAEAVSSGVGIGLLLFFLFLI